MRSGGPERQIRLRCVTPERFLQRLREAGASVKHASTRENNLLILRTDGKSAEIVMALAERYSLKVLEDRPLRRDWREAALAFLPLAAGFLLCAALMLSMANRVWVIRARCPAGGSATAALEALRDMGVSPGRAIEDADALAGELLRRCPGYAHVSAKKKGATLLVELYEETPPPEIYDPARERDLVSRYDAVVHEVKTLSGKAAVKPGDAVRRGQALILGMERETDEINRGVSALGEVSGYVWSYGEATAPAFETRRQYTGETSLRAWLTLFEWNLPLASAETFESCEETEERLPVGGMFLPLQIRRVSCREYREERAEADSSQLLCALEAQALSIALSKAPSGGEIVDKWVDYSMIRESTWIARAYVKSLAPLASTREALAKGYADP